MKLDVTLLRYLEKDDFRVLTAIEMGMKNHQLVPTPLIAMISNLKRGGAHVALKHLHKNKLVWHTSKPYDAYKLTYGGYDYLALKAMAHRGTVIGVGTKIGVGKESDIYAAQCETSEPIVIKLHRLGRVSFKKTVKANRDYMNTRKSASWLYLSRLAALKEYAFMRALHAHGFPVPEPVDWSRHCVAMSLVNGVNLGSVTKMGHPGKVYNNLMNLIVKLAEHGLIHGDFNEFNLMIDDDENITIIDFPQMVSTSHPNAEWYFNRDVNCVRTYFERKYGFTSSEYPKFHEHVTKQVSLDVEVEASGFTKKERAEFDKLYAEYEEDNKDNEKTGEEDEDEEEDDEEYEEEEEDEEDEEDEEEEDEEEDIVLQDVPRNRNRDMLASVRATTDIPDKPNVANTNPDPNPNDLSSYRSGRTGRSSRYTRGGYSSKYTRSMGSRRGGYTGSSSSSVASYRLHQRTLEVPTLPKTEEEKAAEEKEEETQSQAMSTHSTSVETNKIYAFGGNSNGKTEGATTVKPLSSPNKPFVFIPNPENAMTIAEEKEMEEIAESLKDQTLTEEEILPVDQTKVRESLKREIKKQQVRRVSQKAKQNTNKNKERRQNIRTIKEMT